MLEFSTYMSGSAFDDCRNVAVGPAGSTYVLGRTDSSDFPTANAYQGGIAGGVYDMFVAKISYPLDFFLAAALRAGAAGLATHGAPGRSESGDS
jgi:hypothetical protein